MKHILLAMFGLLLLPSLALGASSLPVNSIRATVLIANYDEGGQFIGWGSGFFVDEGIVVTNKHVIQGGDWYRVYATGADEAVDFDCYQKITKSDVKINLNDDVAYMRAYLSCEHGKMNFGEDPVSGDPISVIGYPYKGSATTELTVTSGSVTGSTEEGWLSTDAHMDIGNSGGPVVNETEVVGVAVAKGIDAQGGYIEGYFIPASVILRGLLYANDSGFGYSVSQSSSSSQSANSLRSSSASSVASSQSSMRSISSSSSSRLRSSSSRSSSVRAFPDVSPLHQGFIAIHSLRDRGIITGYADGTFRPNDNINRAELLKILVAGFRPDAIGSDTHCFTDVRDEWFAPYVCAAKRLGWIDGYPDGTFGPGNRVNRAEAMKIVITAFSTSLASTERMPSDVRSGTWFFSYVAKGVALGIVDPSIRFQPAKDLTREEGAMWIYGAEK